LPPCPAADYGCAFVTGSNASTSTREEAATGPFWVALIVGMLVQLFKGFRSYLRNKRWNFRRFVETGGMPSSHSAAVSALTMAVGLKEGFGSTLFGVSLYFSLIVMYDAAGLRQAAGRQAVILNRLMNEHLTEVEADRHRLMELLGHTPLEVLVGSLLGILSASAWAWFRR
jgi:acid phosphatase family membrane protein YuiD